MSAVESLRHHEPVKRWDDLPTKINKLHRMAQQDAENAIERAMRAGELLIEAKKTVGHGGWLNWLDTNITFSARTASSYMRIAKALPKLDDANRQRVADMSFRDYLGSLVTDTNRLSKLPEPATVAALDAAESEPLRKSVTRASTAERVRRQQERIERIREQLLVAEPAPIGPAFRMPAWRVELRDRIIDMVKHVMTDNGITTTDAIEALQDAYCELQDGTLS